MENDKKFDLAETLLRDAGKDLWETVQGVTMETLDDVLQSVARESSQVKQDTYVSEIADILKVSRSAIKKDLKRYGAKIDAAETDKHGKKMIALFPCLVDLVDDGGQVVFLINDTCLHLEMVREIDGVQCVPPDKEHLPFLLPRADRCLIHYRADDPTLFDDLLAYLKRFSYLPDDQWLTIGLYTFQTYLQDHPDIDYQAMVLFYAVPERGKSRTGKAVTNVCFRGVHIVDMREANIFRYSGTLGATIFFDIMDLWKKAERNGSEDILLLRYEKGAQVSRVLYPERGAFKDTVFYRVHGPTLMASNEPVHKILGSRCIPYVMPNAPGNYENPAPEFALDLKERLVAWRARNMGKPLPKVEPLSGISGRLWDITRPLFQICLIVCPERYGDLVEAVLDIAGQRTTEKRESIDGLIIQALYDCIKGDAEHYEIAMADVTAKFNDLWKGDKDKTEKWMGRRIKALMGKKADTSSGRSIIKIDEKELDTLLAQFGLNSLTSKTNSGNSENTENQIISECYPSELLPEIKSITQETQQNSKGNSQTNSKGIDLSELSEFVPEVTNYKNIIKAVEVWT